MITFKAEVEQKRHLSEGQSSKENRYYSSLDSNTPRRSYASVFLDGKSSDSSSTLIWIRIRSNKREIGRTWAKGFWGVIVLHENFLLE